jgi:RimJ/RimL family protein N-acetyltransferase
MRNAVKIGERVWLRPLEVTDARTIALAGPLEPESALMQQGRVPTSVIAFEAWIRERAVPGTPEDIIFAICRRDDDVCIGTVRLGQIDWVNRTAETGTGLLAAGDRSRGLGTEAKHLLMEYAFHDLHLHALNSMVYEGNTRSVAALEKQGHRLAGRLVADVQRGGAFHDTLVFDITHDDWERTSGRRKAGPS